MPKCRLFILLICSFCCSLSADWTTSAPNPISTTYSFTYGSVFNSCNPQIGQYLATWADGNNNQYPTYSIFTPNSGWSTINTISNSSGAIISSNVITSCDPQTGIFVATWTDNTTFLPTLSIYNPSMGWNTIDQLTTSTATVNTANSFNSITGQFLVTWAESGSHYPTYSFYDPNTGWGAKTTITTESIAADVYTTFDSTTGQFLAVWTDIGTGNPMYSFYSSGAWSNAASISNLASVDDDVLCACNPPTGQFIATWSDINQSLYPFYSVYTPGDGWSPIATITTTSGVTDNVAITCNRNTGEFLASWSNVANGNPTYSFYTPNVGWSPPEVISTISSTGGDIITSFNPATGQFLATWSDRSNPDLIFNPTYSFFTYIDPAPPPPLSFKGKVLYNHFVSQSDTIYALAWSPPVNSSEIVSYQISRNEVVIAVVPVSGPSFYYDHNRKKSKSDIYTIVSLNADEVQSTPLSITLISGKQG